jgi:hypothetical protein
MHGNHGSGELLMQKILSGRVFFMWSPENTPIEIML